LRPELLTIDATGAVIARTPGESSGNAIGTAGFDFAHIFNASTKITDKMLVESGAGNTSWENDLALVVSMSKKLALSAGFTYQDNTQPPAGLKKVNTLSTLNLVYAQSIKYRIKYRQQLERVPGQAIGGYRSATRPLPVAAERVEPPRPASIGHEPRRPAPARRQGSCYRPSLME
jgi:hypothetical protein